MDASRQTEHTAAAWLARRDAGPWAEQDQRQLDAWLDEATAHRVAFLRLEAAWSEAGRLQALAAGHPPHDLPGRGHWPPLSATAVASEGASRRAWQGGAPDLRHVRFGAREEARRRRSRGPRPVLRAALSSVALVLLAVMSLGAWHLTGRQQASYASTLGRIHTVALPDGSTATLSSDSQLDMTLSRGERHLVLRRGEAFFDVAKDAGRPFVVVAGERRVAAVGTRFSVRRDPQELRVVVTEGKVRLDAVPGTGDLARPVTLLPAGSVATVGRNGVLVRSVPVVDAERFLEWRSGYLAFDDTSLSAAALEFNRFNARKLEIGDAGVGQLRVGGNFRWSNAEGFARLLEQGFPVQAEYHPDRIVLRSR